MGERGGFFGGAAGYRVFTCVKYLIYLLLCFNIYLFLQEELLALEHTFVNSIEPGQIIQIFAATIDTGAWVVLLLLFELETSILSDRHIKGAVKWSLHGVRGLCYLAIFYAFTGYYAELVTLYQITPLGIADACSLVSQDYSLLLDLDDYAPLDAINCVSVVAEAYSLNGLNIIVDGEALRSALPGGRPRRAGPASLCGGSEPSLTRSTTACTADTKSIATD